VILNLRQETSESFTRRSQRNKATENRALTRTQASPSGSPSIPLTPAVRAAYENLYAQYEDTIENTTDPGVLAALNASQADVDDILTKDDMYRLHANTALFQALLEQIKSTNDDLQKLKDQIAAIASDISTAGQIIDAINKVLSLVPIA
jgi:hypothetical protein